MLSTNGSQKVKTQILLAEDDAKQAEVLKYNLENEGYHVDVVEDGEKAISFLNKTIPDLVLLDWMMPRISGIRVLLHIRSTDGIRKLPVIMLTARGEEDDRVRSFEMGADDFVTKPYMVSELCGRINAILRRTSPSLFEDVIKCGDISVDRGRFKVLRGNRQVNIRATEFRVLLALLSKPGKVMSRPHLIDLAWGVNRFVEERTVNVSVKRLRKALTEEGEPDIVRTVRGAGYSIEPVGYEE